MKFSSRFFMKLSSQLLLGVVFALNASASFGEVYQFAVSERDVEGKPITAFLWVPPAADRIRGVVVGGLTLMEPAFAKDPAIRQACADEKLAIVYFSPPLDSVFNYKEKNSGALLQKSLDDLAATSGYSELAVAPLFPFGHSVSSIFASHVVCWNPSRCFGALAFKGGLPTPANDPAASHVGVPILVIKGQFEEFGPGPSGVLRDFEDREAAWRGMHDLLLQLRAADERNLLAYLVEPGATHFAWSERLAPYTAEFIRQCAKQRIPDWPVDAKDPFKCRDIAVGSGALTSADIGKDRAAASYQMCGGDHKKAFWHLTLDLAKMADALDADLFTKQPQFVTFADPKTGKPIYVGHDLRLKLNPQWTGPDTFRVAGMFLGNPPDKYPKLPRRVEPPGHAAGDVRFRVFCGPVEQTGSDTFRVAADGRTPIRADILAFHPGDEQFRYAEQQGRVNLPPRLTQGKPQTIEFAPIAPLKPGAAPIELHAKSDAGLPVRFYVESGPAIVRGNKLALAEVPLRATYPIKITVVAYQYGSAIEPPIQSAEPVRQTVLLEK